MSSTMHVSGLRTGDERLAIMRVERPVNAFDR